MMAKYSLTSKQTKLDAMQLKLKKNSKVAAAKQLLNKDKKKRNLPKTGK